ncbi:MAG: 1-phosphofructokinase [Oscillospiraceae bacterium]|nr:1-phosphofructokinase [Oscillospiraceae bacterium]
MIYTVTFNPAVDYVVRAEKIISGEVNRSDSEEIYFGGKGINVSLVLAQLGIKSCALGFVAGFTGCAIEQGVLDAGVETEFVHLEKGFSRINVKLKSEQETEINGQGPDIGEEALAQLYEKLDRLKSGDTLVLAGSVPKALPSDIYESILARLSGKGVRFVVDASGQLLMNVLKYRPFLIKPNDKELSEMFGVKLTDTEQIAEYAEKLREMGAQNVLVSMAGDGALLVDENGSVRRCGVCKGTVRNSVGAGDSMVAGFVAGADKGYDYALRLGTACGGATAFSDGLAQRKDIDRLLEELK